MSLNNRAEIEWAPKVSLSKIRAEKTGGNLHAGHAQAAFERFVQTYSHCQEAREKILAIDQLIHEFHWILLKDNSD